MKLERLSVSEWRQFADPFTIDGLTDGINLFTGPNESGKSTLVDAIRAAFFERHNSIAGEQFQPWGNSNASPSVSLDFEWQGTAWKLTKSFVRSVRCELNAGNQAISGKEAEDKLARILGYSYAGRGASQSVHQGIPGLLWVGQGSIQEIRDPVEQAGNYLQTALGEEISSVTSSGDWLLEKVTNMRNELLTKTGRPRGAYKDIDEALEDTRAQLAELDSHIKSYQDNVDALAVLEEQQTREDLSKPWQALREQAREAQKKLDAIAELQQQQEQAQSEMGNKQAQAKLERERLEAFEKVRETLEQRQVEMDKARIEHDTLVADKASVETRHQEAQSARKRAEAQYEKALEQARRAQLQAEQERVKSAIKAARTTLESAQETVKKLAQQRAERTRNELDFPVLEELKKLQRKLDKLELKKEMAATRVQWRLAPKSGLTLDGQDLEDEGERLLLETATLTIPDIGTLSLSPGGEDIQKLARDQARLGDDRTSLLSKLGIKSLAEGERRERLCDDLNNEIRLLKTRLQDLVPSGLDEFKAQFKADEAQLTTLEEQIKHCPPDDPELPDETAARDALDAARTHYEAAETTRSAHRERLAVAEQALKNATHEWKQLKAEYEDPEREKRQQEASRQMTNLNAALETLGQDIKNRQVDIDAAQPDMLAEDVQRFQDSANALEVAAQDRLRRISDLRIRLETLGARGLEAQRSELQEEEAIQERRHEQLGRRAEALDYLTQKLESARQELTQKLQAPLQKHLDHYLKLMFPGSSIELDDKLAPSLLLRDGVPGNIEELSYGAREQLGLVSRLAYADLLKEAGQPTLLILDDAMVHSDAARRAQAARVLYDAASRHQILLFTCHPENWNQLGVPARNLIALKAGQ